MDMSGDLHDAPLMINRSVNDNAMQCMRAIPTIRIRNAEFRGQHKDLLLLRRREHGAKLFLLLIQLWIMNELADINRKVPKGYFFYRQIQHLMFILVMAPGAFYLAGPYLDDKLYLGMADRTWVDLLIAAVVLHHIYVWLVFRLQICYGLLSRIFGRADMAVTGIFFISFVIARIMLLFAVGMSDFGSMWIPRFVQLIISLALLVPFSYTMWSVKKYFGIGRAMLGDHFREKYRKMPLVREGAFKYTSNAMYSFGFLGFWSIAFLCGSQAALALAIFQHAYIWVHMYCVEEPDMKIIHGEY